MPKQNLKRRCTVLLSALFSSTFVTTANENINIEEREDVGKSSNINNNEADSNVNNKDVSPIINDDDDKSVEQSEDINANINNGEINNTNNEDIKKNADIPTESDGTKIENVEKNINVNNTNVQTNKTSKGLSAPMKIGLGVAATAGVVGLSAVGYEYLQYRNALEEAKKAVSTSGSPITPIGAMCISNIGMSNVVWPLKIKLLKLMQTDKCWALVNWLRARLENLSSWDQLTKFDFLEANTFMDSCKNYQSGIQIKDIAEMDAISTDGCLRFILGYLECKKNDLFSKLLTSFDQIPNWTLINQMISKTLKPVGNPTRSGDKLLFKFQTKVNPIKIYELTLKK